MIILENYDDGLQSDAATQYMDESLWKLDFYRSWMVDIDHWLFEYVLFFLKND